MPYISRTIIGLTPNIFRTLIFSEEQDSDLTPNNNDVLYRLNQSVRFRYIQNMSYVQNMSSEYGGTITPPTDEQFLTEWNSRNKNFVFSCTGENIRECQQSLEYTTFPFIEFENLSQNTYDDKLITITWTRMIMALNMYAHIRRYFNSPPYHQIDLIGSKINTTTNQAKLRKQFDNCNVLYIPDDILDELIDYTKNGRIINFWRLIFYTYDNQIDIYDNPFIENTNDNNIPDNTKIAEMILQTKNPLPNHIRKIIYDTCMAFYISHPIEENINE